MNSNFVQHLGKKDVTRYDNNNNGYLQLIIADGGIFNVEE